MKRAINCLSLIIILLFLNTALVYAQQKPVSANVVLKLAYKRAAIERKQVLLVFFASWNPWSAVLKSVLINPNCKRILDRYYIVRSLIAKEGQTHQILENPGADEILDTHYIRPDILPKETRNVPCILFFDKKGYKTAQYIGFPEETAGLIEFENILKKTSSINDEDLATLGKLFSSAYSKIAPPSADQIIQQACKEATIKHKKVFLIFHASWCHWCHVMDTAMNNPVCKKFFYDNYVICHLIVHETDQYLLNQNSGSERLLAKYQGNRNGIPFWVIFDQDGKHLDDFNGFPSPNEADYSSFEKILKRTSSATDQDLTNIKMVFSEVMKRNSPAG